jgi:U3 small nucleolar RNA-associated protein 22
MTSVPYPLPTPTEDANWKVAFEKPANITIVGSWINNVAVKRKDDEPWVVDVVVEMPSARLFLRCFLSVANFSCHRAYFKKRTI